MKQNYTEIEGWCEDEVQTIVELAVSQSTTNSTFVEIGAFKGRSTALISDTISNSGKTINFYTIDSWGPDPMYLPDGVYNAVETKNTFYDNMGSRTGSITVLHNDSISASAQFDDESIDFLFLDNDLSYDHVSNQIQAWLPKVKTGGILSGHDYNRTGVQSAVDEAFSNKIVTVLSGSNSYVSYGWTWRYTSWYVVK